MESIKIPPFGFKSEEILELYEGSDQGVSFLPMIVLIGLGLIVGLFGLFLVLAVDPAEKLTASVFCWIALALVGFALYHYRSKRKQALLERDKDLRMIENYSYAVELTERGWVREDNGIRNEQAWSALMGACEFRSSFVLMSYRGMTLIPKRVLSDEQQELFRRHTLRSTIDGTPSVTARYFVKRSDLIWAGMYHSWIKRKILWFMGYIAATAFLYVIVNLATQVTKPGISVFLWLYAAMVFIIFASMQFIEAYLYAVSQKIPEVSLSANEQGLWVQVPTMTCWLTWISFLSFTESRSNFLIYGRTAERPMAIPKRALTQSQIQTISTLLKDKVGS